MSAQASMWIGRTLRRCGRLPSRVRTRFDRIRSRAAYRAGGQTLPPGRLMHLVAGTDDPAWFVESGRIAAECLAETLRDAGRPIEGCRAVLDFGCGSGRVLRHWAGVAGPTFHGSDVNPALVAWCREHLPFARVAVNGLDGRLDAPDGAFDLIYALSVFTHLTEPCGRGWMAELGRALAPGGCLYLTTHGDAYLDGLDPDEQRLYRRGELVVRGDRREGSNTCAAFHPERYVREVLARGFEVLAFVPQGARGNPVQDAWLLRKR